MDNRANEAYLTAIINDYERQINKGVKSVGSKEVFLKEVVTTLGSLLDFMSDKKATESKSTLELNADLTENVRAYKGTLADKERVITRLNTKNEELHELWYSMDKGKLETENKMLEAENLELKSRLECLRQNYQISLKATELLQKQISRQETKRKELFKECCEAEIENGKYIMEIQDLKTDNKIWQAQCIELRDKLEKATKCQWWID